jgi:hypothetical protein
LIKSTQYQPTVGSPEDAPQLKPTKRVSGHHRRHQTSQREPPTPNKENPRLQMATLKHSFKSRIKNSTHGTHDDGNNHGDDGDITPLMMVISTPSLLSRALSPEPQSSCSNDTTFFLFFFFFFRKKK